MSYIGNQPSSVAFLTDTFSGNASATSFTLSAAPATTSSIIVAVSGVLQDPSTYAVTGTTLNFSAAPPSGTGNISVRFLGIPASGVTTTAYRTVTEFTATAAQTTFTPPSYTVGFINVYRNGVLLGSADYTATNGTTVVLAVGATSGDLVTVESFNVSSVLNAIPATAGAVLLAYINATGTPSSSTFLRGDGAWESATPGAGSITQAMLDTGVAGTGPAFRAYRASSGQSITGGVNTKIQFSTESFDTASCYDSSTNYRFTPDVAGYYSITVGQTVSQPYNSSSRSVQIWKNGSVHSVVTEAGTDGGAVVTDLVYLNGTTDYVEGYISVIDTATLSASSSTSFFSGFLARAA